MTALAGLAEGLERVSLVAFDLDDTLAASKSPMDPRMADLLVRLLDLGLWLGLGLLLGLCGCRSRVGRGAWCWAIWD